MSDPKRSYPYDAADLYAAFKAGLMVSGEGWNGEYPFNGERGKLDERFHQQWLEWFREFTR